MILIDIILGTADWIRVKLNGTRGTFWWPQPNTLKTCIKTRIIERKLKKI